MAAYTQIRRPLQEALRKDQFGKADLDFLADKLHIRSRRETGYSKDEAMRCAKAIRAFQETFQSKRFAKIQFYIPHGTLSTTVEGVKINVSLDASITATKDGVTNSGGLVLLYAFSADRGSIGHRLSTASGLILSTLENGQMEPLPRLCMAVDLSGRKIIKASKSFARFRTRVSHSCKEIAARWATIEPPDDYDGPDWS